MKIFQMNFAYPREVLKFYLIGLSADFSLNGFFNLVTVYFLVSFVNH